MADQTPKRPFPFSRLAAIALLAIFSCAKQDLVDHPANALLREIIVESKDPVSGKWVPQFRMKYQYNAVGQDTAKQYFQLTDPEKPPLALDYRMEYPEPFRRVEIRKDCEQDTCRLNARRVWVTDSKGKALAESTYQWDSAQHAWVFARFLRYGRDTLAYSDTLWLQEFGRIRSRTLTARGTGTRLTRNQVLDSAGNWRTYAQENCKMRGELPLYCRSKVESDSQYSEEWRTYTDFDSLQTQRTLSPKESSTLVRNYDAHRHWIQTQFADTTRWLRIYQ